VVHRGRLVVQRVEYPGLVLERVVLGRQHRPQVLVPEERDPTLLVAPVHHRTN
jgi:hypothetical protein